jgi:hypothetical protein
MSVAISNIVAKYTAQPVNTALYSKKLADKIVNENPKLEANQVLAEVKKQTEPLSKYNRKRWRKTREKYMTRIETYQPLQEIQLDIADAGEWEFLGQTRINLRYLLFAVDVFTRYLWIRPMALRDDLGEDVKAILTRIKTEFPQYKIQSVAGDNEFDKAEPNRVFTAMNLRTYWNIPHDKRPTQIVERCIGTFKRMLQRYSETKKSLEYTIDLQKIVDEYNNVNNQGINTSPVYAMETGTQFSKTGIHRSKQARLKDLYLDVGTKVRKKIKRDIFAKGHHPYYSSRIYEIAERIANNQYRLKDYGSHFINVEKVPRWYLEELDHEKKTNTHTDPHSIYFIILSTGNTLSSRKN